MPASFILTKPNKALILATLFALTSAASADDFTIDSAVTTTNGGNTLDGDDSINVNSTGSITPFERLGISTTGGTNNVTVSGTVEQTYARFNAIVNVGNNNKTTALGNAKIIATKRAGIEDRGDNNVTTLSGNASIEITAAVDGAGIFSNGNSNTITLSDNAKITTAGTGWGPGIQLMGATGNSIVTMSRNTEISTTGPSSDGINVYDGDNSEIYIAGKVQVTGVDSYALHIEAANNNAITLQEGALIIGPILTDNAFASGSVLNIDVGLATSYIYTTTGSWTINELDGRTYSNVGGIVSALGSGNSETADEMLFQRTLNINGALARHASMTSNDDKTVWIDAYGGTSDRSQSTASAANFGYKSTTSGLTIGVPVKTDQTSIDLVLSQMRTELNISNKEQEISANSNKFGAFFKDLIQTKAWNLGGSAMIGSNKYKGSRDKVLDNTTATGFTTLSTNYTSTEVTLGMLAKYSSVINPTLQFEGELMGTLARESIKGYTEGTTFAWQSRDLDQVSGGASAAFVHHKQNGLRSYAKLGVHRRAVIAGKQAVYANNGTSTATNVGNLSETYTSGELGFSFKGKDAVSISGSLKRHTSNNNTSGTHAHLGLNWTF